MLGQAMTAHEQAHVLAVQALAVKAQAQELAAQKLVHVLAAQELVHVLAAQELVQLLASARRPVCESQSRLL